MYDMHIYNAPEYVHYDISKNMKKKRLFSLRLYCAPVIVPSWGFIESYRRSERKEVGRLFEIYEERRSKEEGCVTEKDRGREREGERRGREKASREKEETPSWNS